MRWREKKPSMLPYLFMLIYRLHYDIIFIYMKLQFQYDEKREDSMLISERIFKILAGKNMTQAEFANRVGIAGSTVSEWKKKKTNPSADKILDICFVLEVTPEQLLSGQGIDKGDEQAGMPVEEIITPMDRQIIRDYHSMKEEQKRRLLKYIEVLKQLEELEEDDGRKTRVDDSR